MGGCERARARARLEPAHASLVRPRVYRSASTAGLDSEETTFGDEMRHLRALASVKSMEVSVSLVLVLPSNSYHAHPCGYLGSCLLIIVVEEYGRRVIASARPAALLCLRRRRHRHRHRHALVKTRTPLRCGDIFGHLNNRPEHFRFHALSKSRYFPANPELDFIRTCNAPTQCRAKPGPFATVGPEPCEPNT